MKKCVIGDIHGEYDLLLKIKELVKDAQFIYLGDYIDRGGQSKEVLELVYQDKEAIKLIGNHESLCLLEVEGIDPNENWTSGNGGKQTLASFDSKVMPSMYLDFFNQLPFFHQEELGGKKLIFHHSLLDNDLALEEQLKVKNHQQYLQLELSQAKLSEEEAKGKKVFKFYSQLENSLLWNREFKLKNDNDYILIYGHTPFFYFADYHFSRYAFEKEEDEMSEEEFEEAYLDRKNLFLEIRHRKIPFFIYGEKIKVSEDGNDLIVDILPGGSVYSISCDGGVCYGKNLNCLVYDSEQSELGFEYFSISKRTLEVTSGKIIFNYL